MKSTKKKCGKIGCLPLIIFIVILAIMLRSCSNCKHKEVKNAKHNIEINKIDFSVIELTNKNVKKTLGKEFKNCEINIAKEGNKNIVNIKENKENILDEKTLVKKSCNNTLKVLKKLKCNSKIDVINYCVYANFTDKYGNKKLECAIQLGFTKKEYNKMNIKSLRSTIYVNYKKFIELSKNKYINPTINKVLQAD